MANASFVHRFVTESKHDFATFDHDPRMTVRPQKGITYFLREKRQHATSMFLRVEKMDTEVEERIGGEWGAMGFSGQRDSNINLLCGIGYVVHKYIHLVRLEGSVTCDVRMSKTHLELQLLVYEHEL